MTLGPAFTYPHDQPAFSPVLPRAMKRSVRRDGRNLFEGGGSPFGIMDAERDDALSVVAKIRESGLLLSLATAYFCETPFLKRIGREVSMNLERLKGEIDLLKRQYPGKFAEEVETDDLLAQLRRQSERLLNPDKEATEKCALGELGREMEASVGALTSAIRAVRMQVEGKPVPYTRTEAVSAALEGSRPALSGIALRIMRALLVVLLLLGTGFGYLFYTMERVEDVVGEIGKMESLIQTRKSALARLEGEAALIRTKMRTMEASELDRQEKIQWLEMGVQLRGLEEKQRDLETDISVQERELRRSQGKAKALKEKSFLQRLLRL